MHGASSVVAEDFMQVSSCLYLTLPSSELSAPAVVAGWDDFPHIA